MRRVVTAAGVVLAALLIWAAWTVPPAAQLLPVSSLFDGQPPIVHGAYHVHSLASDGTGTIAEIADAAGRAGLAFFILTDHGDAFREPLPPQYYGRVLCIDATEVSTTDGHYTAIGIGHPPYPLAGEGRDVIEDVTRLGGFGVAAHPDSPRPSLRWREWDAPFEGLEWLNADSEWHNTSVWRIFPTLVQYLIRPAESLAARFHRPQDVLERWDRMTQQRPIVALAANDAHARFGFRPKRDANDDSLYVKLPSYEAAFRSFSLGVELDAPVTGNAPADARAILEAIRRGRVYTALTGYAGPAQLSFGAWSGSSSVRQGGALPIENGVVLRAAANLPPGGSLVLLRNGTVIEQSQSQSIKFVTDRAGVFRVEARLPGAPGNPPIPWVLSNPIYIGQTPASRETGEMPPAVAAPLPSDAEWHIEHDPASTGTSSTKTDPAGQQRRAMEFRLADRPAPSPFVALATASVAGLRGADRVTLTLSASRPLRVSVQVRLGQAQSYGRWVRSVYADSTPRVVSVRLGDMRVAGSGDRTPFDSSKVESLLFVIDTVNARPGDAGTVWVSDVRTERIGQVRTVSNK